MPVRYPAFVFSILISFAFSLAACTNNDDNDDANAVQENDDVETPVNDNGIENDETPSAPADGDAIDEDAIAIASAAGDVDMMSVSQDSTVYFLNNAPEDATITVYRISPGDEMDDAMDDDNGIFDDDTNGITDDANDDGIGNDDTNGVDDNGATPPADDANGMDDNGATPPADDANGIDDNGATPPADDANGIDDNGAADDNGLADDQLVEEVASGDVADGEVFSHTFEDEGIYLVTGDDGEELRVTVIVR